MSLCRHAIVILLLSLSAGLAQADGLFYRLPKDGAWALYNIDATIKANNKEVATYKGTLHMASVGQVTEENQPCRWIEVRVDMTISMGNDRDIRADIFKILVPEIFLAKGETPLEHVIHSWIKSGDGDPKILKNPNDFNNGLLPLTLSKPWKNVKQLDKVEVESKLGKLECEGVQGTLELPINKTDALRCKLESRLHPDSPFGVVSSHWVLKTPETSHTQALMEWNLKLIDFGDGAKSKITNPKDANDKDKIPDAKGEGDKGKIPDADAK